MCLSSEVCNRDHDSNEVLLVVHFLALMGKQCALPLLEPHYRYSTLPTRQYWWPTISAVLGIFRPYRV